MHYIISFKGHSTADNPTNNPGRRPAQGHYPLKRRTKRMKKNHSSTYMYYEDYNQFFMVTWKYKMDFDLYWHAKYAHPYTKTKGTGIYCTIGIL